MTEKKLAGKVALVTGASRGIGKALSLQLAAQGAHVIALARNQGGLEALDDEIQAMGCECTLIPCDLKDDENVDALGPAIYQRWQKLDIFIGNAAVLKALSPVGHVKPEDWDETLLVNLTANWRLLRTLDPVLKFSDDARVMFLTDRLENPAFWGAYSVSKQGLEQLAQNYAAENNQTKINVSLVDPGIVATRLRTQAFPGEKPESLPTAKSIASDIIPIFHNDQKQSYQFYSFRSQQAE